MKLLVDLEAFSLFNETRTKKLPLNDPVAIQLVVKSNTLLGFVKKSAPLTLPFDRLKFPNGLLLWESKDIATIYPNLMEL